MKIKKTLFFIAVLLLTTVVANAAENVTATRVIIKKYQLPAKAQMVSGNCWTSSIASDQPNAFRCMVNNAIYDPCFTTNVKNKLVCNVDPKDATGTIILQLTKPLPPVSVSKVQGAHPWLIQLADGTQCRPYTGTAPFSSVITVPYYCGDVTKLPANCGTGLVDGSIKTGKIWTAHRIVYCANPNPKSAYIIPKSIRTVVIKTVWP